MHEASELGTQCFGADAGLLFRSTGVAISGDAYVGDLRADNLGEETIGAAKHKQMVTNARHGSARNRNGHRFRNRVNATDRLG